MLKTWIYGLFVGLHFLRDVCTPFKPASKIIGPPATLEKYTLLSMVLHSQCNYYVKGQLLFRKPTVCGNFMISESIKTNQ